MGLLEKKDLTSNDAIKICRAAEVMDNKLKTMSLGSPGSGECVNVTEGQ